jgi:hypothetical protein
MKNEKKKTGYQSTWQDQLRDTASKIINREKFTYDLNGDALYKQYKDRYIQQGKQAMMDTMGQAATLTGGYGNSYAQTVGQQTYQGYLQGLNDQVPALYQLALDKYNSEGDQLRGNMSLLMQQDDIDYGRYRDDLADRDNAFSKLMALMTGYGYKPTAEEMAAAGMTDAQMRAILGIPDEVVTSGGGRGSGVGAGGPPKDPPKDPPVDNLPKATDPLTGAGQAWVNRHLSGYTSNTDTNVDPKTANYLNNDEKDQAIDLLNTSGLGARDAAIIALRYDIPEEYIDKGKHIEKYKPKEDK